jgi:hypothetical protein
MPDSPRLPRTAKAVAAILLVTREDGTMSVRTQRKQTVVAPAAEPQAASRPQRKSSSAAAKQPKKKQQSEEQPITQKQAPTPKHSLRGPNGLFKKREVSVLHDGC